MEIPANKDFGPHDIQCDKCGGRGGDCRTCKGRGWLSSGHPDGRTCQRPGCHKPIKPDNQAVYCSNECAMQDA